MPAADWYFDFVSPFAYLQLARFERLPPALDVTFRPVLFAGLLDHWRHRGPAEIPAKRVHTYRWCQWYAARNGIPFRMPPAHPFNPLRPLRLATAHGADATRGADAALVRAIFDALYAEGRDLADEREWRALAARLALPDADALVAEPAVKAALRRNTEDAAARGVFGVPTFAIRGELFWGLDSTALVCDFLADPARFRSGEFARLATLPIAQARPLPPP